MANGGYIETGAFIIINKCSSFSFQMRSSTVGNLGEESELDNNDDDDDNVRGSGFRRQLLR